MTAPSREASQFIVRFPEEETGRAQTSNDSNKYITRFPEGMRQALKRIAYQNGRSLNAEIVFRLSQSLAADGLVEPESAPQAQPEGAVPPKVLEAMRTLNEWFRVCDGDGKGVK